MYNRGVFQRAGGLRWSLEAPARGTGMQRLRPVSDLRQEGNANFGDRRRAQTAGRSAKLEFLLSILPIKNSLRRGPTALFQRTKPMAGCSPIQGHNARFAVYLH